jgi:hypothetical protein
VAADEEKNGNENGLDELLEGALAEEDLGDGLRDRVARNLPEGAPARVVGSWVYVLVAASAVVFMGVTLALNSPVEMFLNPSRLTVSLMVANFGALLIAIGFLGWAADTADFEDSSLALAIQSAARRPVLRLGVKVAYGAGLFLAVLWVLRPAAAITRGATFSMRGVVGGLGAIFVIGFAFAALAQVARTDESAFDRARFVRSVAVVVIVASCAVHYALLAL